MGIDAENAVGNGGHDGFLERAEPQDALAFLMDGAGALDNVGQQPQIPALHVLHQIIAGARLHGLHGNRLIAFPGQHDDGDIAAAQLRDALHESQPIDAGKIVIQQNHAGVCLGGRGKSFLGRQRA